MPRRVWRQLPDLTSSTACVGNTDVCQAMYGGTVWWQPFLSGFLESELYRIGLSAAPFFACAR